MIPGYIRIIMDEEPTHILVIEDDPDTCKLLAILLKHKNYKVTEMLDPVEVELYLQEHNPDLILMDFLLRGKNGGEVCSLIKSNPVTASIPIVVASAFLGAKNKSLDSGANAFIEKPFDIETLFSVIEHTLKVNTIIDEEPGIPVTSVNIEK